MHFATALSAETEHQWSDLQIGHGDPFDTRFHLLVVAKVITLTKRILDSFD